MEETEGLRKTQKKQKQIHGGDRRIKQIEETEGLIDGNRRINRQKHENIQKQNCYQIDNIQIDRQKEVNKHIYKYI